MDSTSRMDILLENTLMWRDPPCGGWVSVSSVTPRLPRLQPSRPGQIVCSPFLPNELLLKDKPREICSPDLWGVGWVMAPGRVWSGAFQSQPVTPRCAVMQLCSQKRSVAPPASEPRCFSLSRSGAVPVLQKRNPWVRLINVKYDLCENPKTDLPGKTGEEDGWRTSVGFLTCSSEPPRLQSKLYTDRN